MTSQRQSVAADNVSRDEFESYARHVDQNFSMVGKRFDSIENGLVMLGNKFDAANRPQIGNWIAAVGVLLPMVSMAALLVWFGLSANRDLMHSEDQRILSELEHQKEVDQDLKEWQRLQDDRIRELELTASRNSVFVEMHEKRLDQKREWILRNQETINRLDEYTRHHIRLDENGLLAKPSKELKLQ